MTLTDVKMVIFMGWAFIVLIFSMVKYIQTSILTRPGVFVIVMYLSLITFSKYRKEICHVHFFSLHNCNVVHYIRTITFKFHLVTSIYVIILKVA